MRSSILKTCKFLWYKKHMPEKVKMIRCFQCKEWIHQTCEKAITCRAFTERIFVWHGKSLKRTAWLELMDGWTYINCSIHVDLYIPLAACCSVWLLLRNCLYKLVCTCTYGAEYYMCIPCVRGRGGQIILKRTDNPRKDCPRGDSVS